MKLFNGIRKSFLKFEGLFSPLSADLSRKPRSGISKRRFTMQNCTSPYSLKNVVKKLETFAPISLAESWDNVGLLVEPPSPQEIKRVLLTNDLSKVVLKEAIDIEAQLIISYHPLIFPSLKRLNCSSWKEAIVGNLLERRMALYSPHTAWDCVEGGVNDWLASAFGNENIVTPLKQHNDGKSFKVVHATFENETLAKNAIYATGCFSTISSRENGKVCVEFHTDNEYDCLPLLQKAENISISNRHREPSTLKGGQGRKIILKEEISLQKAINCVKEHLGLKDVAVAVALDGFEKCSESALVKNIALCAGSGGSVLKGVQADLYLTGEMSHHEILDAVHKGIHVILTRHSNSERGFLQVAATQHLKNLLPEVEFVVSATDKDPLETK